MCIRDRSSSKYLTVYLKGFIYSNSKGSSVKQQDQFKISRNSDYPSLSKALTISYPFLCNSTPQFSCLKRSDKEFPAQIQLYWANCLLYCQRNQEQTIHIP
eukprot:TRINITY_DN20051_c0_g1_i1.p4 TRINITY_DN20051_c0_g1~~TRINITY_DN20051_c0_g1_i1.p4  ORF type:complete len:101 (+),score=3.02 TRINITY_DN20051_c0_g1_i1:161-463(+)